MVNFALHSNGKNCFADGDSENPGKERCKWFVYRVPLFEFGWDTLKDVVSVYNQRSLKRGETKDSMLVEVFCTKTNRNLLPFFAWYNMRVSQEVHEICESMEAPEKITKWLAMADCVKKSIESFGAKKDIMECANMEMFPHETSDGKLYI